jgi:beta-glucosidase-like glycosyl hydrolase
MASKKNLELRRQVGQLLIMGFDGTVMSQRLRVMLGSLQPSGIILFKRNLEHAEQTHALLSEAQKAATIPMFLCVDMEGGTVDRLRDVIAPIPPVSEVAAAGSKKLFRRHGRLIGEEVSALGFNTDFAPVFDLRFEESKSVLGSRTVSETPKETVAYARSAVHRQEVEATVEGRPGAVSQAEWRAALRDGGTRSLSAGHWRPHSSVALEEVDQRHLA